MDQYPTYRDAGTTPHQATTTKPTDVGLPRSRRTYALPIFIGLVVFALIIVIRIVWGSINMVATTEEAMTPGDAATPPAAMAPATAGPPEAATETPEAEGTLDRDVEPQPAAGPGEVQSDPGAIDVPGGETTEPVAPAPAQ
jgi:hypothetical protein